MLRERSEADEPDDEPEHELGTYDDQWTTIVVKQLGDGRWFATQGGIPIEGRGDCASEAVADYCESLMHGRVT